MKKKLKSMPANHPRRKMLEDQVTGLKTVMIIHRLILEDKERLRLTADFMGAFLELFLGWIGFGASMDIEIGNFLEYMPAKYLTCMSEFHQMYYSIEEDYAKVVS